MQYITLKTSQSPHREVNLIDCAIWNRRSDSDYDAIAETPNGTKYVSRRARRRNFDIDIEGIGTTSFNTLKLIDGNREEFWLEGNIGENTKLYVPFERSVVPLVGPATGAFARNTDATYIGDDGIIRTSYGNVPRFETGKLGLGLLTEKAKTNYFYPSYGSSGNTLWTAGTGTPAIAWDTNAGSNVEYKTGSVRILFAASNDTVTRAISGLTSSAGYTAYVWARGVGSVELSVTSGASGSPTSGTVALGMAWQLIAVEGFTTTATSITLTLTAKAANTQVWLSAHQVEDGYTYTSYIPAIAGATYRAQDQVYYLAGINYAEGSIAMWVKFPRITASADGHRHIFRIADTFYGAIYANGDIYFNFGPGGSDYILVTQATHACTAGQYVHIAFVWKRDYVAIIVNGVAVGTNTGNARAVGSASTFQCYYGTSSPNTVIDDLRFDDRYVEWRTSESGLYLRYSDAHNLDFCKLTQGRRFRIARADFDPVVENGYLDGRVEVVESWSDANHTIEVA